MGITSIEFPETSQKGIEIRSCYICPLKDSCKKFEEKNEKEKKEGCAYITSLTSHIRKELETHPANLIKKAVIDINVRLKLQKIIDGNKAKPVSKQYINLQKLNLQFLRDALVKSYDNDITLGGYVRRLYHCKGLTSTSPRSDSKIAALSVLHGINHRFLLR